VRQLWRVAERAAAANGDPHPTVVLAAGPVDHQRAERLLSGDGVIGHERVYAVELRGHFTCICVAPAGSPHLRGTVIALAVRVGTWAVLDFGLGHRWARLSALGHPFVVHP
jgi:hypothetical protein